MRCPTCGTGRVRDLARSGRTLPFRTMKAISIPADLEIPTCDNCGETWLDELATTRLQDALESQFRVIVRGRFVAALDEIVRFVSQRKLEERIGLSQGYLSKLRSGVRDASPELVSLLGLIAIDPGARITELSQFWATGSLESVKQDLPDVEVFSSPIARASIARDTTADNPTAH